MVPSGGRGWERLRRLTRVRLVAVLGLLVALLVAGTAAATPPDIRAIRDVVAQALNADMAVFVTPATWKEGPVDSASASAFGAQGQATLKRYFTGSVLMREQGYLSRYVESLQEPQMIRTVSSGARDVKFDDIQLNGQTAAVKGSVYRWASSVATIDGSSRMFSPSQRDPFTATLVHENGVWLVDTLVIHVTAP